MEWESLYPDFYGFDDNSDGLTIHHPSEQGFFEDDEPCGLTDEDLDDDSSDDRDDDEAADEPFSEDEY